MRLEKLEKEIEADILDFLRTIGIFCWKQRSLGVWDNDKKVYRKPKGAHHMTGVADILGVIQGRFLAIEVKSEKGVLSNEQRIFIRHTQEEGGIAFVARSVEQTATQLLGFFPDNQKLKQFCKEYIQSKGMDH